MPLICRNDFDLLKAVLDFFSKIKVQDIYTIDGNCTPYYMVIRKENGVLRSFECLLVDRLGNHH